MELPGSKSGAANNQAACDLGQRIGEEQGGGPEKQDYEDRSRIF
jgi:hypothetical protein